MAKARPHLQIYLPLKPPGSKESWGAYGNQLENRIYTDRARLDGCLKWVGSHFHLTSNQNSRKPFEKITLTCLATAGGFVGLALMRSVQGNHM